MKIIFTMTMIALALTAQQAKADFISLPFSCHLVAENNEAEIKVSVVEKNNHILGHLQDDQDSAELNCERLAYSDLPSMHYLDCTGTWSSDGSVATLSSTLDTYVPMIQIQKSKASGSGNIAQGVCVGQ